MIVKNIKMLMILFLGIFLILPGSTALAAEQPIVIGAPLSTAFLYGWGPERAFTLAIEEINATGGVNVGGTKRPFKL